MRFAKLRKYLLSIFLFVPLASCADAHQTGKITRIVVDTNYVSIWLENNPSTGECLIDGRWVIDFTTDKTAREKYSAAVVAATSKSSVAMHYFSQEGCGAYGAKKVSYIESVY